jgi:polyvinyl alcohol dehydrogenase (cytochrome)
MSMRAVLIVVAFVVIGVPEHVSAQSATPNGEAVYKQHCAACHEGSMPRMPSREAVRKMAPEAIETALSSFAMRRQAAALTPAERRAVAAYLTDRSPDTYRAPLELIGKQAYCSTATGRESLNGASWNGWAINPQNSRAQSAANAGLTAANVPRLKLKWSFGVPGVSASGSQVTVLGNRAFVGTRNGLIYSLDAKTGCIAWAYEADAGVRSTPVVVRATDGAATVYFGDAHAQVYALDALTGARRWKVKIDDHPDAMITGGIAVDRGRLYVPVSSLEEGTAAIATYECCTFRGSLVALDAATGQQIWKTFTIPPAQQTAKNARGTQLWGPSGGAIWSQPALDAERNRLFVATGDSYSNPPAKESDAIMSLAMDTGRVLWVQQTHPSDAWNISCVEQGAGSVNCPEKAGPDFDFGSSPALATLSDGRHIVLAGQKSGVLHALNADTGAPIWKTQVGEGGVLGGIEWGFAVDGTTAYVSLSSAFEKKAGEAGGLVAINIADGTTRWTASPPPDTCNARPGCNTGQPAAVSLIPGVVFSGSLDGHLRAYDSKSGKVVFDVNTQNEYDTVNHIQARGGSLNGPGATVVGGIVFVSSGYSSLGFMPGNVLLAFSVDGK